MVRTDRRRRHDGASGRVRPMLAPVVCAIVVAAAWAPLARAALGDGVVLARGNGLWRVHEGSVTRLTDEFPRDAGPAWSPDRTRIAFSSGSRGDTRTRCIWILSLATMALEQITDDGGHDTDATWAPDGQRVAFVARRRSGIPADAVWVADLTTGALTRLTGDTADIGGLAWSPDGSRIALHSQSLGGGPTSSLWAMDALAGTKTRLTDDGANDAGPTRSPDGSRIAFTSQARDGAGGSSIWTLDTTSNALAIVTDDGGEDIGWPTWSPGGAHIAFASLGRGASATRASVFVKDLDLPPTDGYTRITDGSRDDRAVDWGHAGPFLDVAPTSGSAGAVRVSTTGTATITIGNVGFAPLTVTDVLSDDPQFAWSGGPVTVAPGGSETLAVRFSPSVVGWERASITIIHDAGLPRAATVSGIGTTEPPVGDLAFTRIAHVLDDTIRTVGVDGSDLRSLTVPRDGYRGPDWAPRAEGIVAHAHARSGPTGFGIVRLDLAHPFPGATARPVTSSTSRDKSARMSPDGASVAFTTRRDGAPEVYTVGVDGSNESALAAGHSPTWSPDGSKVAFVRGAMLGALRVVRADGADDVAIADGAEAPAWSPDGSSIAYGDGGDIIVAAADGSSAVNLTASAAVERHPTWSPDGSHIAFVSSLDGDPAVFAVRADGSDRRVVAMGDSPAWSPFPAAGISLSPPRAKSGATVVVAGHGFGPGESVDVQIPGEATVTTLANAVGTFEVATTLVESREHGVEVAVTASASSAPNGIAATLTYDSRADGQGIVLDAAPTVGVGDGIAVSAFIEEGAAATFSIDGVAAATAIPMAPTGDAAPTGFVAVAGAYTVTSGDTDGADAAVTVSITDDVGNVDDLIAADTVTIQIGAPISLTSAEVTPSGGLVGVVVSVGDHLESIDALSFSLSVSPASGVVEYSHVDVAGGLLAGAGVDGSFSDLSHATFMVNLPGLDGVSGSGELAGVYFRGLGDPGDEVSVSLNDVLLVSAEAVAIPAHVASGPVTVALGCVAGDANGDGVVNVLDITKIERIVALIDGVPPAACVDANHDGVVNVLDITATERIVVGLPPVAPAPPHAAGTPRLQVQTVSDDGTRISMGFRVANAGLALDTAAFTLDYASRDIEFIAFRPMRAPETASHVSTERLGSYQHVTNLRGVEGFAADVVGLVELARRHPGAETPVTIRALLGDASARPLLDQRLTIPLFRIPEETALLPNYPNPFNPETWLPFDLAATSDVDVTIYAANGVVVRVLRLGQLAAGTYHGRTRAAYWDGRNATGERVGSGVYVYRIQAGDHSASRRMIVAK